LRSGLDPQRLVTGVDKIRHLLLGMGEKQSQFEELLLTHLDGAYNFAYWLVLNHRDAQAIVQQAYAQAWQEFGEPREANARVWLLTLVLRTAQAWIYNRSFRSKVIGLVPLHHRPDSPRSANPDAKTVTEKSGPSFCNALGRLPAEFREILVLHEAEGWTYQQLSALLGITREEIATKLSAARRSLRQELGDSRWTE
jgi:RNA polymerase sigma-70 factor, ECF subfamily